MTDGIWRTTITELLLLFREGLLAVLPIAERAKIPWSDEQAYDDWDVIARGLYEGIVRMSVIHSQECSSCEIPRYGLGPDKNGARYVVVRSRINPIHGAFVSFSSREGAFSHVRVRKSESDNETFYFAYDECEFLVGGTGLQEITSITVVL